MDSLLMFLWWLPCLAVVVIVEIAHQFKYLGAGIDDLRIVGCQEHRPGLAGARKFLPDALAHSRRQQVERSIDQEQSRLGDNRSGQHQPRSLRLAERKPARLQLSLQSVRQRQNFIPQFNNLQRFADVAS